jgi:cbb3-type cytochrome oxidase maturation protein
MDVIYFLIPLALILLASAIAAFMWAARSGQFEDLDREAHRILFDEDIEKPVKKQDAGKEDPAKDNQ